MPELSWGPIRDWLVTTGVRVVIILVLTWVTTRIVGAATRRFSERYRARHPDSESAKRVETLSNIMRTASLVVILATAGMVLLSQIGVQLGPILAAAGIGGLAIGFGAQNLVRDVISGFFILLEDQVRVGDVVQLNGQGGLVEAVTLRYVPLGK